MHYSGIAQLVEHLTVNQVVVSSSLTAGVIEILIGISFANLAQLVEHLPRKEKVVGSIPIIGTQSIKEVRCENAADFFCAKTWHEMILPWHLVMF